MLLAVFNKTTFFYIDYIIAKFLIQDEALRFSTQPFSSSEQYLNHWFQTYTAWFDYQINECVRRSDCKLKLITRKWLHIITCHNYFLLTILFSVCLCVFWCKIVENKPHWFVHFSGCRITIFFGFSFQSENVVILLKTIKLS